MGGVILRHQRVQKGTHRQSMLLFQTMDQGAATAGKLPPPKDETLVSSRRGEPTPRNGGDGDGSVSGDATFNPLVQIDLKLWQVAPPVLGLMGLGIYAGYRKQVQSTYMNSGVHHN